MNRTLKLTALLLCLCVAVPAAYAQGNGHRADLGEISGPRPPMEFSVVTPEDIEKLYQVAIKRGESPSYEGLLFLKFERGALRQYDTLKSALGLFARFVAIESIDFIQEEWQVNVLHQDEIDQWVASANANGTARYVWHKHLLEDKAAVLKEEFFPVDEDSTKAIVEKITARFLTNLNDVSPNSRAEKGRQPRILLRTTGND